MSKITSVILGVPGIDDKLPMQDEIEAILFRRSLGGTLEGGTLPTAREIAELLSLRSAQTSPAVEVVPAGFDVTDMAMIRRGDRIGPKLGARVADALVAASSSPPSVSSEPVAVGPRIKPQIIADLREWAEFEQDGGNVEQGAAIDVILDWYDRQTGLDTRHGS